MMSHDGEKTWDRADAFLVVYEWLNPLVDWVFYLSEEVVPGFQDDKLPQQKMDTLKTMFKEFRGWSHPLDDLMESPLSLRLVGVEESIQGLLFGGQDTRRTFESEPESGKDAAKPEIKIDGLEELCEELNLFQQWLSESSVINRAELTEALSDTAIELNTQLQTIALTAMGWWGFEFAKHRLECLPDDFFEQFDTGDPDLRVAVAELIQEASLPKNPFVATPLQSSILEALDGKAFKKEDLAWEVGLNGDGSRFYRPGSLKELQTRGMVRNKRGVGYYRPDKPPPNFGAR